MAVSGSKNFELDVADYVEEAFERCGLELRTGYDLKTATRSLNLMLAEWANRGLNQWTITQKVLTLVKDTTSYTIDSTNPTATIDVLDVFIRETLGGVSTDVPMTRMSRSQYANISTKSTTGKPNQYLIDKPTGRIHHKNPIAFEDSQGGVDCPNLIPRFAVFDPDDVIDLRRAQAEYCYVFVS